VRERERERVHWRWFAGAGSLALERVHCGDWCIMN
jgi:hypothetical protein